MIDRFQDRADAGRRLAAKLARFAAIPNLLVLALPRGGVPVAYEVAKALHAPLDVYTVRKLGVPGHEELAMGAIASGGTVVYNDDIVGALGIDEGMLARVVARESLELARREAAFRGGAPGPVLTDRTIILVDDGLATGATMRAAVMAVRLNAPRAVIVAVPVASLDTSVAMHDVADEVVCAATPVPFHSVGTWYVDFTQTTDEEVRRLLGRPTKPRPEPVVHAEGRR